MLANINVRFFSLCYDDEGELDIVEVNEAQFLALQETPSATIEYAHHTVHENGVRQVCLTVHTDDCPHLADLERYKL